MSDFIIAAWSVVTPVTVGVACVALALALNSYLAYLDKRDRTHRANRADENRRTRDYIWDTDPDAYLSAETRAARRRLHERDEDQRRMGGAL